MNALMVSLLTFWNDLKDRANGEKGATATEYALLIAFVALVIIVGAGLFGTALSNWFSDLATNIGSWAKAAA
ncbi:Flp family type IVb pilin [Sinomonas sp. JGH33]|uniref:Flp family type IVb pilin n=1 Tax=Sinomonas terricola TaxID=3110330 RepID=A0ABU5T185_9MICC|nr:Flp family type IVb pilin [Sinomonas sp. JGH33]MEA5453422.1 Flp family type IVb pilin [Sinomonas sp. JGH33]